MCTGGQTELGSEIHAGLLATILLPIVRIWLTMNVFFCKQQKRTLRFSGLAKKRNANSRIPRKTRSSRGELLQIGERAASWRLQNLSTMPRRVSDREKSELQVEVVR